MVRSRRHERGQAMVEYALVAWLLIIAFVLTVTVEVVPQEGGDGKTILEAFFEAIQSYRSSVDFMLSLPVP